ncbi:hypothetical protein [Cytobacillus purgationiresistens]|uniref:Effector of murein hydrolase LrgA (UPF0299 family) n=1 Tax=Cytobacillus purgationiresistens TaxID=863449 RepID=A0ABU0AK92_9BACI|nr:hypothetical protein [Cytobacillus purgationiresistens]MDQ0271692.1 putative effector of murein hydrolase LrgA (UPF0299 family) [Cytobacillus purgationiresistens]
MKNLLMIIVTALILFGTVFLRNGLISLNTVLFVGIIIMIVILFVFIVSKIYPDHVVMMGLSICGFTLLLFVPCLATLSDLTEPLNSAAFNRYLLTFMIVPVLWIGAVILAYRRSFIAN